MNKAGNAAGKVLYVIVCVIFSALTMISGAAFFLEKHEYNKVAEADTGLVNYNGKLYEQEKLLETMSSDVSFVRNIFIVFLVISVVLIAVGIIRKKKHKENA